MFNDDDKPPLLRGYFYFARSFLHYHLWFKKRFVSIGSLPRVWGIWNVEVHGPNISLGRNVTICAADKDRVSMVTLNRGKNVGHITIGSNVLLMNGVRISSAAGITIGDGSMLANYAYLMDSDWHDIHDRTEAPGRCAPIVLGKGVWIGDSAIVCKGVTIGENSIVGAGSVVRRDIPANCIAIGNPARVVKKLDPKRVKTAVDLEAFYNSVDALGSMKAKTTRGRA